MIFLPKIVSNGGGLMQLRCQVCDPPFTKEMRSKKIKPNKSINTDTDDYVKVKNGYYHDECYIKYLTIKKKKSLEEAEKKLKELKMQQENELKELRDKEKFLNWIMDYYDGSLPTYFLKKLQSVRDGTYEGIPEPIDYSTLLDIYQHMAKYLNKLAVKKNFQKTVQRMNYDLAVVIGNYGDYKKYKKKQRANIELKSNLDNLIKEQERINQFTKTVKKNKDTFNLADVLEDITL